MNTVGEWPSDYHLEGSRGYALDHLYASCNRLDRLRAVYDSGILNEGWADERHWSLFMVL